MVGRRATTLYLSTRPRPSSGTFTSRVLLDGSGGKGSATMVVGGGPDTVVGAPFQLSSGALLQ